MKTGRYDQKYWVAAVAAYPIRLCALATGLALLLMLASVDRLAGSTTAMAAGHPPAGAAKASSDGLEAACIAAGVEKPRFVRMFLRRDNEVSPPEVRLIWRTYWREMPVECRGDAGETPSEGAYRRVPLARVKFRDPLRRKQWIRGQWHDHASWEGVPSGPALFDGSGGLADFSDYSVNSPLWYTDTRRCRRQGVYRTRVVHFFRTTVIRSSDMRTVARSRTWRTPGLTTRIKVKCGHPWRS